jgi:FkbM family methyltransferase
VPEYAAAIEARLAGRRAIVHPYGLAGATREVDFVVAGDGSSAVRPGTEHCRVRMRAAAEVFEELGLARVGLMKVNIEGGEYELLEHLLDRDLIRRVDHVQVQFHDFVPGATRRMRAIQARLQATHALSWQYVFIWESWCRRSPSTPVVPGRVAP